MGFAKNKVFYLDDMLKQKDKKEFFEAINKEVTEHNKQNHYEIVSKANLKVKAIKSIWSFKHKRNPAS